MKARVQQLADRLSEEAIRCRVTKRHDWKPETAGRLVGGWECWEYCANNCKARRYSILSNTGHIVRRDVRYPNDGYLLPRGERLDLDDMASLRMMVFHWDFDSVMGEPQGSKTKPVETGHTRTA